MAIDPKPISNLGPDWLPSIGATGVGPETPIGDVVEARDILQMSFTQLAGASSEYAYFSIEPLYAFCWDIGGAADKLDLISLWEAETQQSYRAKLIGTDRPLFTLPDDRKCSLIYQIEKGSMDSLKEWMRPVGLQVPGLSLVGVSCGTCTFKGIKDPNVQCKLCLFLPKSKEYTVDATVRPDGAIHIDWRRNEVKTSSTIEH